jgi:hypothetical protein
MYTSINFLYLFLFFLLSFLLISFLYFSFNIIFYCHFGKCAVIFQSAFITFRKYLLYWSSFWSETFLPFFYDFLSNRMFLAIILSLRCQTIRNEIFTYSFLFNIFSFSFAQSALLHFCTTNVFVGWPVFSCHQNNFLLSFTSLLSFGFFCKHIIFFNKYSSDQLSLSL